MKQSPFVLVLVPVLLGAAGPIPWVGVGLALATLGFMWLGSRARQDSPPPPTLAQAPPTKPADTVAVTATEQPQKDKSDLSHIIERLGADGLTLLSIQVEQKSATGALDGNGPGVRALQEVAHTVQSMLRSGDTFLAREEGHLIAVVPGIDRDTSRTLVTRLVQAVDSLRLVTHAAGERRLAITVGRAFMPQDGTSLDALLEAAVREANDRAGGPMRRGNSPAERLSRAIPLIPN